MAPGECAKFHESRSAKQSVLEAPGLLNRIELVVFARQNQDISVALSVFVIISIPVARYSSTNRDDAPNGARMAKRVSVIEGYRLGKAYQKDRGPLYAELAIYPRNDPIQRLMMEPHGIFRFVLHHPPK